MPNLGLEGLISDELHHPTVDGPRPVVIFVLRRANPRISGSSVRRSRPFNHRPYLQTVFTVSARALADTDPEAAATIQGSAHSLMATSAPATGTTAAADAPPAPPHAKSPDRPGLIVETRRETTRHLVDVLGDERLRALRDHGATMDTDTAVAYTLSRLDEFLTNADA
jgi:hypothetical protein